MLRFTTKKSFVQYLLLTVWMPVGSLTNDDVDGNENGKKAIGLIGLADWAKQQLCTCITLFCIFRCTTTRWNCLIPLSVDDVSTHLSVRACLHGGGEPQIGEVTCAESPHLWCKRDPIKMSDYMDRRVTSPTWGPPPPCKQALRRTPSSGPDSMVRLGDVLSNIFPTFVLSILIGVCLWRFWLVWSLPAALWWCLLWMQQGHCGRW